MAKTLEQIIADARQIIAQPDSSNSAFSDSQLTRWANDAYRRVCISLRNLPVKERDYTVSAGGAITLNSATVTIDTAKIQVNSGARWKQLVIWKLDDLFRHDPDWENADAGEPVALVRKDTTSAILWPPPNAASQGAAYLTTYGMEMPTELSASSDTPNLPENLHDIFCHWVAHRCFQYLNEEQRSTQQLVIFNGMLKDQKGISAELSRHKKRWSFDSSEDWDSGSEIRVS